jgi:hypothetical protein
MHNNKIPKTIQKWNEHDGLVDRQWAYPEAGKLPEDFDRGAKVPVRFHREFEKHNPFAGESK